MNATKKFAIAMTGGFATLTLIAGPIVTIQVPVPAVTVQVPAPAVTVETTVPDTYVWDGVEYVGVVGTQYYYLGDGNVWLLQEVTTRLPGRVIPATISFGSAGDLASALRRAEAAHGQHEKRTGQHDAKWSDWYAAYMVAEQAGTEAPK